MLKNSSHGADAVSLSRPDTPFWLPNDKAKEISDNHEMIAKSSDMQDK